MNGFYGGDPKLLNKLGNRGLNFAEDIVLNISVYVDAQHGVPEEKGTGGKNRNFQSFEYILNKNRFFLPSLIEGETYQS
jgi:hypothetical protein